MNFHTYRTNQVSKPDQERIPKRTSTRVFLNLPRKRGREITLVIQRVATHLAHAGTFIEKRGKKNKYRRRKIRGSPQGRVLGTLVSSGNLGASTNILEAGEKRSVGQQIYVKNQGKTTLVSHLEADWMYICLFSVGPGYVCIDRRNEIKAINQSINRVAEVCI